MQESTPGITFNETMAGSFALGLTDPKAIESHPKSDHHELAMHATVMVDDINRFVSDPNHLGSLSGQIDFAPFGKGIPASTGVFNLFAPTNDPKLTYMVYELGFTHENKSYYLAGHKEVRNDPGIDIWSDTTTLYTTLYEGTDRSGTIVGAGILRLGMTDLIKLMSTMRATNADSHLERATAIATFGKFFMRELWEKYGPSELA